MNKRNRTESEPRLLDLEGLQKYMALGKDSALKFARDCNAELHVGTRALYDKRVIDKAIDKLSNQ